jgi:hypothetical protein
MAYIDNKLGSGEKIVHTAHQHPFVLIRVSLGSIGMFVLGLILLIVGFVYKSPDPANNLLNILKTVLIIAGLVAMFVGIVGFLIHYLNYINEEFIVTNERVIQVEGIFNKRELDSSLSKVNDIQTFQTVFGRLFNYGTINIVTGNESGINRLDFLSNPFEFKRKMLDAKNGLFGDASDLAPQPVQGGRYVRTEDGERRVWIPPQQPQQPQQPPMPYPSGVYDPRQQHAANPAPGLNRQEIPAMIQELARLRDAGIITQEEFQAKKNDLLRRL